MIGEPTFYFSYGANMRTKIMRERGIEFKESFAAVLYCYKRTFTKPSRRWGAAATIENENGKKVEGVVYELSSAEELEKLDRIEGVRTGDYCRIPVRVFIPSLDKEIEAIAYKALKFQERIRPSEEYLFLLIEGGIEHGLSVKTIYELEDLLKKSRQRRKEK